MARLEEVRIASAAFKRDPYPFYARLRAEAPVLRIGLPDGRPAWLVARHADVAALLRDPRLAKDPANAARPDGTRPGPRVPRAVAPLMRSMLDRDDPDHARLRRLVGKAFTPRRVEAMRDRTAAIAEGLLDRLARQDRFDLIRDFALPLPVTVISEMLGVPERDRARFARFSRALVGNTGTPLRTLLSLPHVLGLLRYLRRLLAAKRAAPGDDLATALLRAQEDGAALDADELLSMVALLLSAGHETTTNLIGNGMLALLRHPEEAARLRAAPDLLGIAVEELLRYDGPVETATNRYAREDIEVAGTRIARGDLVLCGIASANRDPAAFAAPDRLDLGRAPNRHLAFGAGGHHCLGAALARLEGGVAIEALLRRLPGLGLAQPAERLRWRPGQVLRGLEALPVLTGR